MKLLNKAGMWLHGNAVASHRLAGEVRFNAQVGPPATPLRFAVKSLCKEGFWLFGPYYACVHPTFASSRYQLALLPFIRSWEMRDEKVSRMQLQLRFGEQ